MCNCSDGHDAVCHGNNLSGGWANATTPNEPVNYTGGLYSADLFLEHVIPEIEESPAFKEGGLIDVTFDEGFPPFTYSGNVKSASPGLDKKGHIGYAAQPGLAPFGPDVFNNPQGPKKERHH